ncbi:sugar ABC transporter permease [Gemmiger formicilis]|uniref:ABC transporter permease n=1 Tax=Gemmiger formicilis TaxID=745368 RepID=UPI001D5EC857|nr:ABC transporter permease subunit [Gemmiger formicilis]MBM6715840.1 sugar ABC transporter permease [Gemmiger formicilis]
MKNPFKKKAKPGDNDVVVNSRGKLMLRVRRNRDYYLMLLPALIYVALFCYAPMYGLQIAFKNYKMSLGVTGSPWIGFQNFTDFFNSYYFGTLIKNTLVLSLYSLLVGFPIPIILALVLNELGGKFKKFTQTILYAPHFISLVVLVSMLNCMLSPSQGVVNTILEMFGLERNYFMANPDYFPHLYVWSGVWQGMGWGAIIYLAALSGIDPALYEAADMDGATRLQKIIYINLPALMPTIIIMLILRVGQIASVGYEKVFLMQNDFNLETAEVISTYVYKRGLVNSNYSFAAAVDLFNNVINVTLVLIANKISKLVSDTSLF